MANKPGRAGERGLSLIEAVVVVTITALLALILLPLASGAARRNAAIAGRAVDVAEAQVAEREFRILMGGVSGGEGAARVTGGPSALTVSSALPRASLCAPAGTALVAVTVLGGELRCASGDRRRVLLRWRGAEQARFTYSVDGQSWSGSPPPGVSFVRFQLQSREGVSLLWIVRAGAGA